ncbi:hypothetical protein HY640_04600 [Candidatus Woesearchaeota archaeon]|nr:hypothetical protein [Candidatus Woesearchaeota archaeon]
MRSRKIGKKAQIDELLVHITKAVYVIWVLLSLIGATYLVSQKKIETEQTELAITHARIISGISAYDKETGRTYLGTSDSLKTTDQELGKAIHYGKERKIAASLEIESQKSYYNKRWFERLKPRKGYDVESAQAEYHVVENGEGKKAAIEVLT